MGPSVATEERKLLWRPKVFNLCKCVWSLYLALQSGDSGHLEVTKEETAIHTLPLVLVEGNRKL